MKRIITSVMLLCMHMLMLSTASAVLAQAQVVPFKCSPKLEFAVWKGNPGGGQDVTIGTVVLDRFTDVPNTENWVEILNFEVLEYTTPYGTTTIGRPGTRSWVRAKIEQAGWVVVEYWFQGVTVQSGFEYHLSGGAIEGRLAIHTNAEGGVCIYETWSVPERIDFSVLGKRISKGSIGDGSPSLMFAELCHWRFDTWGDRQNHLIFNQITTDAKANTLTWQPFESVQPGTDMRFDLGWVKITFPTC